MTDDEILEAIHQKRYAQIKRELALKVKKKSPKSYHLALNAYYLLCTGNSPHALEAATALAKKTPSDPQTLDLLHDVFVKLGQSQEALAVYEAAVAKYRASDVILAWFNKAVKAFDYRMLRGATAAMSKHAPSKRSNAFLSAFASYMEFTDSQSDDALQASYAAMKDLLPTQNNQETFMYTTVLSKMGKHAEVADILDKVEPKELELVLLHLDALDQSAQWQPLYDQCHKLLFAEKFNDYDTWKYLIKSAKQLKKPLSEITSLIQLESRNAYMANIYAGYTYDSGLDAAVESYYNAFASKPCCYNDLSNFTLAQTFYDEISGNRDSLLAQNTLSGPEVSTLTNIEKLLHKKNPETLLDWSKYSKFDNPELSDLYLAYLVQQVQAGINARQTLEHIIRLENYAEKDSENFNIRIWLLNLYSTISATPLSVETYHNLKVKMIQTDTLGYKLHLDPTLKNLNELVQMYRFYLTSDSEIETFVDRAIKQGLFTKLEDLFRFGKRLQNSLSRHLLTVELLKMTRMLNNDYHSYFLESVNAKRHEIINGDFEVSDNRDFSTDFNLGFDFKESSFFGAERIKSKEYVQLFYVKELLIKEDNPTESAHFHDVLEQWLKDSKYTKCLQPSELHFFKVAVSLCKAVKLPESEDHEQTMAFLKENLEFKAIESKFLQGTSPLSAAAHRVLTDTLELVKLTKTLSAGDDVAALAKTLQLGLLKHILGNPEMTFYKELVSGLEVPGVPAAFVETQLGKIEDAIRSCKVKMN